MAFGWKTEYEKRVDADNLSNWEIFVIAEKACKELDWDYLVADEKTFTTTTPIHWTLNEEVITITVANNEIVFKSQSESLELYEAGRNKKNIEETLLPLFNKIKSNTNENEIRALAETLKTETLKQLKSGNRISSEKITFGLADHEVTFFLLLVNVVVFGIMIARGVDLYHPTAADITRFGGNVREFVAVGEWWRLVTNLFVHLGLKALIINLLGLYFIGLMVETILGKVKFLIAYITAGALASLASIYYEGFGVTAGASGAIAGLYGILLAFAATKYVNRKFNLVWFVAILAYAGYIIWIDLNEVEDQVTNISGFVAGVFIGGLFYFFHFKRNIARAGGTRISIEIMLITALLIFLFIRTRRDDSLLFEKAVMRLNQIELKAMTQMQQLQTAGSDAEAADVLKEKALPLWTNFQKELLKTDKYRLDDKFTRKRKLLHDYSDLRIKQTDLIYKSISEGSDNYNDSINIVSDRIDSIIDQIGE